MERSKIFSRLRSFFSRPLCFLLLEVLGYALGQHLSMVPVGGVPVFWPGQGVYLAFLIATPSKKWPQYVGLALFARLIGNFFVPAPRSIFDTLVFWLGSTIIFCAGAALFKRWARAEKTTTVRYWVLVLIVVGVLVPIFSAAWSTTLSAYRVHELFSLATWRFHFVGKTLGIWIVTPLVLSLLQPTDFKPRTKLIHHFATDLVPMLVCVAIAMLIFFSETIPIELRIPVLVIAPLTWISLRGNIRSTALAIFLVSFVAIVATTNGEGPFLDFYRGDAIKVLTSLQLYLAITILTQILLSAAVCSRIEGRVELESLNRELQRSNESFNQLFEQANDAIFIMDPDFNIINANLAAAEISGYTREQLRTMNSNAIVLDSDSPGKTAADQRAIKSGRPILSEIWHRRADGSTFLAEVSANQISDGRILGTVRDITARKEMEIKLREREEELQIANAELERFTSIASHDLQEPLRTIRSFLQLIWERHQGSLGQESDEFMKFVMDAANRMKSLIEQLLNYARVGKNNVSTMVDCGKVATEAVGDLKALIDETHAQVKIGNLPKLVGDPNQLHQLFQNLIANGIRYNRGDDRSVEISSARLEKGWEFSVADNGIGIAPKDQARIFDAFQRGEGGASSPGTGLGLSVCRKIVEQLGGRLWVDSTPGEGSTFHFFLPDATKHFLSPGRKN